MSPRGNQKYRVLRAARVITIFLVVGSGRLRTLPQTPISSVLPEEKACALRGEIQRARQSGDFRRAEALCRDLIQLQPDAASGYILLGQIHEDEHNFLAAADAFLSATKREPTSFDAHYHLGVAHLRAGEARKAVDSLTHAVSLAPNNRAGHCTLGQALLNTSDAAQAVEQFRLCAEMDPQDIQGHYDLGQAYLRRALTVAEQVLESDSASPYARRIFAENYLGRNDLTEAETQYRMALVAEPDALDLHLALGELYLRRGNLDEAGREYQDAVGRAPASIAALYRLAEADFLHRDLSSAISRLKRIAELNPGFLASEPDFPEFPVAESTWVEMCTKRSGLDLTEPGDLAISFLQNACQRGLRPGSTAQVPTKTSPSYSLPSARSTPAQAATRISSPSAFCFAGLCKACEEQLQSALSKPPGATAARLQLGHCAYAIRDYESAYGYFSAAEKSDPQNVAALYWLQESARRLAQKSFERVREIDPDSYLTHLLSAQTWEEQQRPDLAIQEYKSAIAWRPAAANIRVLLGSLYWKWEKYDEALPQLLEALRLDPAEPAANYLVGDIWVQKHQPERALPYLEKALALRPGFFNAEASLGRALAQLGRIQEAVTELAKVASADADGSIHYELYQLYRKLGLEDEAKKALATSNKIRSQRRSKTASKNGSENP